MVKIIGPDGTEASFEDFNGLNTLVTITGHIIRSGVYRVVPDWFDYAVHVLIKVPANQ
jgi:hypothetical protein